MLRVTKHVFQFRRIIFLAFVNVVVMGFLYWGCTFIMSFQMRHRQCDILTWSVLKHRLKCIISAKTISLCEPSFSVTLFLFVVAVLK